MDELHNVGSFIQRKNFSKILEQLQTFREKDLFSDCTIVSQGKHFSVHKLILSSCSNYFKEILDQTTCCHPILIINEVNPIDLDVLLNYMYEGTAYVSQERLSSLIREGQSFKIKGFTTNELTISIQEKESRPTPLETTSGNTYNSQQVFVSNCDKPVKNSKSLNKSEPAESINNKSVSEDNEKLCMEMEEHTIISHSVNDPIATKIKNNDKIDDQFQFFKNELKAVIDSEEDVDVVPDKRASEALNIFNNKNNDTNKKSSAKGINSSSRFDSNESKHESVSQMSLTENVDNEGSFGHYVELSQNDTSISQKETMKIRQKLLKTMSPKSRRFKSDAKKRKRQNNDNAMLENMPLITNPICKEEPVIQIEEFSDQSSDFLNYSTLDEQNENYSKHSREYLEDPVGEISTSSKVFNSAADQDPLLLGCNLSPPSCSKEGIQQEDSSKSEKFVEYLLLSHGLDCCAQVCKEHEISQDSFESLDSSSVQEICPKIGHQIQILKLIKRLKQNKSKVKRHHYLNDAAPLNNSESILSCVVVQPSTHDITKQKIISLLWEKNGKLLKKLCSDSYAVTIKEKHAVNRILTDWLCYQCRGYPSSELKLTLARVVCETFPRLCGRSDGSFDLWYQPHTSHSKAGGLIELRVQNWRKNLLDEDKKFVRSSRVHTHKESPHTKESPQKIVPESAEDKNWLKEFSEPPEVVREKMALTFSMRHHEFLNLKFEEALSEWPHIKDERFINLDYQMVMSEQAHTPDGFLNEFPVIANKIVQMSLMKERKYGMDDLQLEDPDLGSVTNKALYCLPHLLPQGIVRLHNAQSPLAGSSPGKLKCIRPSYVDAINHFIMALPEETNIEEFCKKQENNVQPFVAVTGTSVCPTKVFLILGSTSLECSSLLTAVDLCFKVHHIFNLKYPSYVKNTYLFLERHFYKVKSTSIIPTCVFEVEQNLP